MYNQQQYHQSLREQLRQQILVELKLAYNNELLSTQAIYQQQLQRIQNVSQQQVNIYVKQLQQSKQQIDYLTNQSQQANITLNEKIKRIDQLEYTKGLYEEKNNKREAQIKQLNIMRQNIRDKLQQVNDFFLETNFNALQDVADNFLERVRQLYEVKQKHRQEIQALNSSMKDKQKEYQDREKIHLQWNNHKTQIMNEIKKKQQMLNRNSIQIQQYIQIIEKYKGQITQLSQLYGLNDRQKMQINSLNQRNKQLKQDLRFHDEKIKQIQLQKKQIKFQLDYQLKQNQKYLNKKLKEINNKHESQIINKARQIDQLTQMLNQKDDDLKRSRKKRQIQKKNNQAQKQQLIQDMRIHREKVEAAAQKQIQQLNIRLLNEKNQFQLQMLSQTSKFNEQIKRMNEMLQNTNAQMKKKQDIFHIQNAKSAAQLKSLKYQHSLHIQTLQSEFKAVQADMQRKKMQQTTFFQKMKQQKQKQKNRLIQQLEWKYKSQMQLKQIEYQRSTLFERNKFDQGLIAKKKEVQNKYNQKIVQIQQQHKLKMKKIEQQHNKKISDLKNNVDILQKKLVQMDKLHTKQKLIAQNQSKKIKNTYQTIIYKKQDELKKQLQKQSKIHQQLIQQMQISQKKLHGQFQKKMEGVVLEKIQLQKNIQQLKLKLDEWQKQYHEKVYTSQNMVKISFLQQQIEKIRNQAYTQQTFRNTAFDKFKKQKLQQLQFASQSLQITQTELYQNKKKFQQIQAKYIKQALQLTEKLQQSQRILDRQQKRFQQQEKTLFITKQNLAIKTNSQKKISQAYHKLARKQASISNQFQNYRLKASKKQKQLNQKLQYKDKQLYITKQQLAIKTNSQKKISEAYHKTARKFTGLTDNFERYRKKHGQNQDYMQKQLILTQQQLGRKKRLINDQQKSILKLNQQKIHSESKFKRQKQRLQNQNIRYSTDLSQLKALLLSKNKYQKQLQKSLVTARSQLFQVTKKTQAKQKIISQVKQQNQALRKQIRTIQFKTKAHYFDNNNINQKKKKLMDWSIFEGIEGGNENDGHRNQMMIRINDVAEDVNANINQIIGNIRQGNVNAQMIDENNLPIGQDLNINQQQINMSLQQHISKNASLQSHILQLQRKYKQLHDKYEAQKFTMTKQQHLKHANFAQSVHRSIVQLQKQFQTLKNTQHHALDIFFQQLQKVASVADIKPILPQQKVYKVNLPANIKQAFQAKFIRQNLDQDVQMDLYPGQMNNKKVLVQDDDPSILGSIAQTGLAGLKWGGGKIVDGVGYATQNFKKKQTYSTLNEEGYLQLINGQAITLKKGQYIKYPTYEKYKQIRQRFPQATNLQLLRDMTVIRNSNGSVVPVQKGLSSRINFSFTDVWAQNKARQRGKKNVNRIMFNVQQNGVKPDLLIVGSDPSRFLNTPINLNLNQSDFVMDEEPIKQNNNTNPSLRSTINLFRANDADSNMYYDAVSQNAKMARYLQQVKKRANDYIY